MRSMYMLGTRNVQVEGLNAETITVQTPLLQDKGKTQNQNDALSGILWGVFPKDVYVGAEVLQPIIK